MCRVVPHEHRYETGSIGTILSFHLLTNYQYTGKGRSNKNLVTLRVVRNAKTVTLQQSSKKKKQQKPSKIGKTARNGGFSWSPPRRRLFMMHDWQGWAPMGDDASTFLRKERDTNTHTHTYTPTRLGPQRFWKERNKMNRVWVPSALTEPWNYALLTSFHSYPFYDVLLGFLPSIFCRLLRQLVCPL